MNTPATNLQFLRRSRPKPAAGDIFAVQPPDGPYLFGRVIRTDVLGPMKALLIYIYSVRSDVKEAPAHLSPEDLLIPPVLMNRRGWTHGVFETIESRPLEADEVLTQHCFQVDGRYYDENHHPLPERVEPCGTGGLGSFEMLDDRISDALGIPRAPT